MKLTCNFTELCAVYTHSEFRQIAPNKNSPQEQDRVHTYDPCNTRTESSMGRQVCYILVNDVRYELK